MQRCTQAARRRLCQLPASRACNSRALRSGYPSRRRRRGRQRRRRRRRRMWRRPQSRCVRVLLCYASTSTRLAITLVARRMGACAASALHRRRTTAQRGSWRSSPMSRLRSRPKPRAARTSHLTTISSSSTFSSTSRALHTELATGQGAAVPPQPPPSARRPPPFCAEQASCFP